MCSSKLCQSLRTTNKKEQDVMKYSHILQSLKLHLKCPNLLYILLQKVKFNTISYSQKIPYKTYFFFMMAIFTIITHSYSKNKFYLNIWSSMFIPYFILFDLINAQYSSTFLAKEIKTFLILPQIYVFPFLSNSLSIFYQTQYLNFEREQF